MAIYRGPGGAGDATTDSSTEAAAAINAAAQAATSATNAASSASSASTSATNATTQATNAANSATSAASSASAASTSASNASTSATNAASSATTATTKASEAASSATAAASSASAASTSATNAASSASAASTSATNAASSATSAANSATTATTQATNASNSAIAAASSATSAASSASTATTQATNASNSATAAAASASTATTKASEAATSATNAATSATNAANSATAAATSATNASNSASAASTSATNAASSATSAASSASAAAASYDSFDDRYLGPKSVAPTVDNDGNTLLVGALYFNTVSNFMKVWDGSSWLDAYASLSGALLSANNLSDLTNAATARTNLGLGTAATTAATDYATAAQGTKADTAYGWGNHASAGYAADSLVAHLAGTETITGAKTFSSTITGSITGNAGTVTNGVYTTGSYADPTWITSIAGSKVSGNISGNAATATTATNQSGGTVAATTGSFSSSVTLSGGTANGVAYLNGSKVLTTGSALTFDGTALNFGGTAQRITGDFSNATISNRLMFQTSTLNTATIVGALPSGTGTEGRFSLYNSSDTANTSTFDFRCFTEAQIRASYSGTGTYLPITLYTGGSERMRIDTSGNVGIGTSSPAAKLDVASEIRVTSGSNVGRLLTDGSNFYVGTRANIPMRFETNSTTQMIIDTSGNVGIGTSSPAQLVEASKSQNAKTQIKTTNTNAGVNASAGVLFGTSSGDNGYVGANGGAASSALGGANALQITNLTASPIVFATNSTERMRIDSSGDVFVASTGTSNTSVGVKLLASGAAMFIQDTTGDGPLTQFNNINATIVNAYRFASFRINSGATEKGTITYNTGTGQVNYNQTSDRRLKTNIEPAKDVLSMISQVEVVSFDMIDGGHTNYGVIAQDLVNVFPEAVSPGDDGEDVEKAWGVDVSNLVPALVKAIQELKAELDATKAEVAALKGV